MLRNEFRDANPNQLWNAWHAKVRAVVFYVSEKVYCSLIPLQGLIQMIAPSFQGVMSNRGVLDLSDCHSDSNMRHRQ